MPNLREVLPDNIRSGSRSELSGSGAYRNRRINTRSEIAEEHNVGDDYTTIGPSQRGRSSSNLLIELPADVQLFIPAMGWLRPISASLSICDLVDLAEGLRPPTGTRGLC